MATTATNAHIGRTRILLDRDAHRDGDPGDGSPQPGRCLHHGVGSPGGFIRGAHRARESARGGRERAHGARHARHHAGARSTTSTRRAAPRVPASRQESSSAASSRCATRGSTAWSIRPTTPPGWRSRSIPGPDNILGNERRRVDSALGLHARDRDHRDRHQRRRQSEPAAAARAHSLRPDGQEPGRGQSSRSGSTS